MANTRIILHVIDSLAVGGAEMLLVNFIRFFKKELPESKHYLVTLSDDKTLLPILSECIEEFKVIHFGKKNIVASVLHFRHFVKAVEPQLVHSHLFNSTMLARLGTPRSIPVFSTYHNNSYCRSSPYFSPWFSRLDRMTFRKNHYRIFVSRSVQECVEDATKTSQRGVLVTNFVEPNFCASWNPGLNSGLFRLVAVGNLKTVKNHLLLIKALSLVNSPNIMIDIYGEGELRPLLEKEIEAAKVQIRLKGTRTVSSELLGNYDAFILPSISEGQPVSLLEAMATGLPCLLSDIQPLRDLAEGAAVFFSPESPQELAKVLAALASDRTLLSTLSAKAIEAAEPYKISRHFETMLSLYEQPASQETA